MSLEDRLQDVEEAVRSLGARVDMLSGTHVELVGGAVNPEGEMVEGPHAELVVAEGPPPGMSLEEWVSGISGSPGFLVDPGLARATPCIMLELGPSAKPLVYSKGIVGALDEEQRALYCQEGVVRREASEAQKHRLQVMRESAKLCSTEATGLSTAEHLASYFSCLGRELRSQGQEP